MGGLFFDSAGLLDIRNDSGGSIYHSADVYYSPNCLQSNSKDAMNWIFYINQSINLLVQRKSTRHNENVNANTELK